MKRLKIEDGSQWPDPQGSEIEWRFRHARKSVTDADLLCAAEVLAAYEMLLHSKIFAHKKLDMIRRAIKSNSVLDG